MPFFIFEVVRVGIVLTLRCVAGLDWRDRKTVEMVAMQYRGPVPHLRKKQCVQGGMQWSLLPCCDGMDQWINGQWCKMGNGISRHVLQSRGAVFSVGCLTSEESRASRASPGRGGCGPFWGATLWAQGRLFEGLVVRAWVPGFVRVWCVCYPVCGFGNLKLFDIILKIHTSRQLTKATAITINTN